MINGLFKSLILYCLHVTNLIDAIFDVVTEYYSFPSISSARAHGSSTVLF